MNLLLDPNVAYLILVTGFILAVLALFTPGTGILEIGALFAIFIAGYAVYNLPINLWALILLVVGVFPFLIALRKSKKWVWLLPALASIVVGSVFLFRLESGAPAIDPFFATIVSAVAIFMLWFIGRKSIEAMKMGPSQDLKKSDRTGWRSADRCLPRRNNLCFRRRMDCAQREITAQRQPGEGGWQRRSCIVDRASG